MTMTKSAQEAYQNGYTDGASTAERMRWRGTPIGDFLRGSLYQPDANHRSAYDTGFKHAMENASRGEWMPPYHES